MMQEKRKVFYIRRAIFLIMAIAVAIPLLVKISMPIIVSWPTRDLYEAVESLSKDKIVVISVNWGAGTQGETAPQTAALIYHLASKHKKFAIWGWATPQGPLLTQQIAEPIAQKFGLKYGVDWVNWGFKTGSDQVVRAWAKDIPGTMKEDFKHTPMTKLPFMKNVRDHKDIGLIVEITGSATVGTYIRYLYGIYGTPIAYACTGVMVPEAFPYLDAGQLVGMMRGLVGAAEYEELAGYKDGKAGKRMAAQSFAHMLIIALIIVGNVGYFIARRSKNAPAEGGQP